MIQVQVFISSLLLLLPGAVDSDAVVKGVVGHPVTLPRTYPTDHGVTTTCWGKGECQYFYCARTLIWTDGYQVTYQSSSRYQLKGNISEGNVSLTIENAVQSDSGPYCCVVEMPGVFRHMTYSLEVEPEIPVSPPMNATTTSTINTTRANATGRSMTTSTRPTHPQTSTRVSNSSPPMPAHTQTKPDCNNTVTSSKDAWSYDPKPIHMGKVEKNMTKGFYAAIAIAALLLLLLLGLLVVIRLMLTERKSESPSLDAFLVSRIEALQNTAIVVPRGEDKVYVIEDSPCLAYRTPVAF